MKLRFATSSNEKFREAITVFPDLDRVDIDLPEIQSADQQEIVRAKLTAAIAQGLDCVMVEDTGLELECLGGLPGPFIKFFVKRLGARGLYDIATKIGLTGARAVTIAACCVHGRIYEARGVVEGALVEPRGESGFGFDPVFLPRGQTLTYAQMSDQQKCSMSHRAVAMQNLRAVLSAI